MALFVKGWSYLNIFVNSVVVLIVLLKISRQCESGEAVHTTSTSSTTLQPKLQKLLGYDWYEHEAVHTSTSSITLQPELQPSTSSATLQPKLQMLPGCDADWTLIREANYIYVDKTPHLMRMLLEKPHKNYFVTRPRGFGKSTFIQMIAQFFYGKKSLFHNLEIDAKGNNYFRKELWLHSSPFNFENDSKWIEFPVVELDFSTLEFSTKKEFDQCYHWILNSIATKYNIIQRIAQPPSIREIINMLNIEYNLPVIVLIDEYDSPFQYALVMRQDEKLATYVIDKLNSFFRVIKASHQQIGFAFVVGITKIGLSNFYDMTYDEIMAHTFGFTEEELVKNMKHYLKAFAEANNYEDSPKNTAEGRVISEMKENYNGYNFNLENNSAIRVMNPISTIQCLANQKLLPC